MPIELQCGECSGVLAVEEPGGMVACPHCGAHLLVPSPAVPELAMSATAGDYSAETLVTGVVNEFDGEAVSDSKTEELPNAVVHSTCEAPTELIPDAARRSLEEAMRAEIDPNAETAPFELPAPSAKETGSGTVVQNDLAVTERFTLPASNPSPPHNKPQADNSVAGKAAKQGAAQVEMVPKAWLHWAFTACSILGILVLSLGYAVSQQLFRRHQLESLPDLAPPKARSSKQSVTHINVPFDAPMPPLHTLRLGQTQRFGDLEVTPVKVEKSPVEFSHFDATVKESRPATAPVLKLVLRVRNVGAEAFAPFDHGLIFGREPDPKNLDLLRANNFVCGPEGRNDKGHRVLMYDQTAGAVWDLKGQLCGRELAPGETVETYLATEEHGLDELAGDLVWRFHFRKGHNAFSGRGVTTLVEVKFHMNDVDA